MEIDKLPLPETMRLANDLAQAQMESASKTVTSLDSEKYFRYRNLSKAISGKVDADIRLILNSSTFDEFLRAAGARSLVLDPFPNPIPGSPTARTLLFEDHVAPATVFSQEYASYAVLSDKNVIMNSAAREMFDRMHSELLAAIDSRS